MDKFGGFVSLFSTSNEASSSLDKSNELEMNVEEKQKMTESNKVKGFTFPGSSAIGTSIKTPNFFGFRAQGETIPLRRSSIDNKERLQNQKVEGQNEAQDEEEEEPSQAKKNWLSFAGMARAKFGQSETGAPPKEEGRSEEVVVIIHKKVRSKKCDSSDEEEMMPMDGSAIQNVEKEQTESSSSKKVVEKSHQKLQFFTWDGCRDCFVCKADFSYESEMDDDWNKEAKNCADPRLNFRADDVIIIFLPIDEDGYCQGELLDGTRGRIHSLFVPEIVHNFNKNEQKTKY